MKKILLIVLILTMQFSGAQSAEKSTSALALEFMELFETVRQPQVAEQDFDRYFEFMATDVVDYHAAYGVTIKGKEAPRKNLIKKQPDNISFSMEIEDLIVGTSTAVVVVTEDSEYRKKGKYKRFSGRTILVLEFNEQNKVQAIRRYLD